MAPSENHAAPKAQLNHSMMMTITSRQLGRGDDSLGTVLMENFFHALTGQVQLPQTIAFYNSGALLVTKDSKILSDLLLLTDLGVNIVVCGTCVKHYKIEQQLGVGAVSNMFDITSRMLGATALIQL